MKVNKKKLQSESTKKRLLAAVEKILTQEGFVALKVENISKVSGVDKKLIYFHFGDLKGLLRAFLKSRDFWFSKVVSAIPEVLNKETISDVLTNQFVEMKDNPLLTQLLIWELSEKNEVLQALAKERDEIGNTLLTKIIKQEGVKDDIQPLLALMVSGIYYLSMHATINGSEFCGVDINKKEDAARVINVIQKLLTAVK